MYEKKRKLVVKHLTICYNAFWWILWYIIFSEQTVNIH